MLYTHLRQRITYFWIRHHIDPWRLLYLSEGLFQCPSYHNLLTLRRTMSIVSGRQHLSLSVHTVPSAAPTASPHPTFNICLPQSVNVWYNIDIAYLKTNTRPAWKNFLGGMKLCLSTAVCNGSTVTDEWGWDNDEYGQVIKGKMKNVVKW